MSRERLRQAKSLIVKIGSSLLSNEEGGLNLEFMHGLGRQLKSLRESCPELVLVSSGAVAAGLVRLDWNERPRKFTDLQVAAAVGQMHLFRLYDEILSQHGFRPAQYLLTSSDLSNRATFLNSRCTLRRLVELGLLPVINENDALAISAVRLGDNDHFAAEIANLLEADLMVILTDVDGIYTDANTGQVLDEADAGDSKLQDYVISKSGSKLGSGGMASKLHAAKRAAASGTDTVIANGRHEGILPAILAGEKKGSLLRASESHMRARERWLAHSASPAGGVMLDSGAVKSVRENGNSLLPIGIVEVTGVFQRGDLIEIGDTDGKLIARGLSNYDSKDVSKLLRKHSKEIGAILGFVVADEVVHRDNMVLL